MAKKVNYMTKNVDPFSTGIRNFTNVFKYFLYYAPNIDSCQSIGRITGETADNVLTDMLNRTNMNNNKKTRFLKSIRKQSWGKSDFDTDIIDFESPRLLCQRYNSENELTALLRHIRNAFAHGYIYVVNNKRGHYIMLVDYDSKKTQNTAKIIVSMTILETWKAILENHIAN